jgi:hypothetical protein
MRRQAALTLVSSLLLGLVVVACHPRARHPRHTAERMRIDCDGRVEAWQVGGETKCPRVVHAPEGCYLVRVKYREDFARLHHHLEGLPKLHTAHYATPYIAFALQLRTGHSYYVTATFNGDEFMPRIIELGSMSERTREILPAASLQELEDCKARTPLLDEAQAICQWPSRDINPSLRYR